MIFLKRKMGKKIINILVLTISLVGYSQTAKEYYERGLSKCKSQDYNGYHGAVEDFTKAIAINPNYGDAYYKRGLLKNIFQDYPGIIQDLTKAIKINPKYGNVDTYSKIANAKSMLEDYKGSIADYTKVLQINPKDVDAYIGRAGAKQYLKDYKGATQDFTKIIEISPNYDDICNVYYHRGNCKIALKQKNEACLDFSKSAELGCKHAHNVIKESCR